MRRRRLIAVFMVLGMAMGTATAVAATPPAVAAGPQAAAAPVPAGPAFAHLGATPLPNGFRAIEVDATTQRVFVSSPTSSVVTVLGFDGAVQGSIGVPGAGALLLDGPTLYVASTTAGRIDTFSTSTLAPTGSYGAGVIVKPNTLAKAGGRVWTTTGVCSGTTQLVSFTPGAAPITVHPPSALSYCPQLYASPTDPNLMLGFDTGISPGTAVRLDVSSGAPVVTGSLWDIGSNTRDLAFMPDGQTFAVASGAPYEIPTFRVNPLERFGVVYPTGPYPDAVEVTAANGGLLAAGRFAWYDNDIDLFRLGDPSQTIFRYDFGTTANTLWGGGLAFGPDGKRFFAVSGDDYTGTAMLNVFGPPDVGGRYHPLPPARILDTRDQGPAGRLGPGAIADVKVTGLGGVPATGVSAVALNVTVTQPTATSFLALFPTGMPPPGVSNLNFTAGQTVPNLVIAKVGAGGMVSMLNAAGSTHVILDVAGWYSNAGTGSDGRYTAVVPSRLLDTRTGGVRVGPNASIDLQVAGQGGVPATGAMAAVLNITAAGPTATSFLTVHPTGVARPLASNLNFDAGRSVSNRVMATLGTGGKVTIYNLAGSTDIVVDVGGWYSDTSGAGVTAGELAAGPPYRVLDSRDGTGGLIGPLAGGTAFSFPIANPGGEVKAVVLNITVVDPTGPGFLTAFPSGGNLPLASDVNYAGGETRPNLTVVRVGADGRIVLYTSTTAQVVLDVAGWFS